MADRFSRNVANGPPDTAGTAGRRVLVIGPANDDTLTRASMLGDQVYVAPLRELDRDLLAELLPGWVVFPLIGAGFDASNVIAILAAQSYVGRACVVAPRLPNRRMVEIELRSIAPALYLDLYETSK